MIIFFNYELFLIRISQMICALSRTSYTAYKKKERKKERMERKKERKKERKYMRLGSTHN